MTSRPTKRAFLTFAAAGLTGLGLSGCVSLLPKTTPAQLYRFGFSAPAGAAQPAGGAAIAVYRANGAFQRESAGDRILTVTGERAAYIAEARWVAPAEVLFDEATSAAFEGAGGRVQLVARGERQRSDFTLRLDVRNFEADYAAGEAPQVLVRVRAVLTKDQTSAPVAERMFEASVHASENRVGAIVGAYDQAVGKVLGDVVAWANASLG